MYLRTDVDVKFRREESTEHLGAGLCASLNKVDPVVETFRVRGSKEDAVVELGDELCVGGVL